MKLSKELLGFWVKQSLDDSGELVRVIREKGVKHFQRPLVVAGLMVAGAYIIIYKPAVASQAAAERQLANIRAVTLHSNRYTELKDRLAVFSERLPDPRYKDTWLLDTIRDTMKQEEIASISLSPVAEKTQKGFVHMSLTVTCRADYNQLGSWIARLERSKQLLYISNLSMSKDPLEIGKNKVTITIGTLFAAAEGAP